MELSREEPGSEMECMGQEQLWLSWSSGFGEGGDYAVCVKWSRTGWTTFFFAGDRGAAGLYLTFTFPHEMNTVERV